jgi:type II secretory pathway pseudopilin PulG
MGSRGYTFIEVLVVATIIMILASAIMPLAKVTATRAREAELRHTLREMRTAIDKFKDAADLGQIGSLDIKVGSENYPPDLQTLVDGVSAANDATGRKLKYLRRIPTDPMTHGSGRTRTSPTRRDGAGRTCSTSTRRSTARRSTAASIKIGNPTFGHWGIWSSGHSWGD